MRSETQPRIVHAKGLAAAAAERLRTRRMLRNLVLGTCALLLWSGCAGRFANGMRPGGAEALRLAADSTTSAEPLYQLALLHRQEGRPDAAMSTLHEALQRDPAHEASLAFLAMLLHETGRSIEALQFFAARPAADWPETVRFNIALLHAATGNTQEARTILSGLEHGGLAATARANLAYLDLLDEDDASAAARLEALGAQASPEVRNNVAVARLRRGDVDGAVKLLEEIIAREPQFAPAHFNLALVLRHYRFDDAGAVRRQIGRAHV